MKAEATERLLGAIRQVLQGGVYLSDKMQRRVLGRMGSSQVQEASQPLDQLSDRELEVLRLLGQAMSTRQIANELHLSVKTIESHRAHLKQKLSLKSGAELIQYALRLQGERFEPMGETGGVAREEQAAEMAAAHS